MARTEWLLEKKVNLKYMQVKVLRNIARMRKKGGDIRTGWIGR